MHAYQSGKKIFFQKFYFFRNLFFSFLIEKNIAITITPITLIIPIYHRELHISTSLRKNIAEIKFLKITSFGFFRLSMENIVNQQ